MPEQIHDVEGSVEGLGESLFSGKVPIQEALRQLRLRLLDLTGRNRLINFKHTAGRSLQFIHSSIDGTFQRLISDATSRVAVIPLPEPERNDWQLRNGRLVRPDPKEYARRIGIDPSYDLKKLNECGSQARTLMYADDLGKHCRKLDRDTKLAIEETGANTLYLVMGFLEYPESPTSDKLYRAPILCVPVSMARLEDGRYTSFHIQFTGEELADNQSLREKVKRDFALTLPEYDIEGEFSPETYFDNVELVIASLPNWRVRRMMTLTHLSFTNMLLFRDLDPDNWPKNGTESALLAHPLVRQVFEGSAAERDAQYAEEYSIDDHPGRNIPLIFEADSSQHSALIDVLEGKNRVIEGPPGTGKSQTITNLIASSLQAGKKVLFVAEKLAALEVVKTRLAQAGLDKFILELHSNKTNRKRVLEEIGKRIQMRVPDTGHLEQLLEQLEQKRIELKCYAELMNSKVGNNLDLTLHQVMWRAERHRLCCGECYLAVQELRCPGAIAISLERFEGICDRMRYLAGQLSLIGTYGPEHKLWGFFPVEFKPEDDVPIRSILQEYSKKFDLFSEAISSAAKLLGGEKLNMSAQSAERLINALSRLAPAELNEADLTLLPRLFAPSDPDGHRSKSILQDIQTRQQLLAQAVDRVRKYLLASEPASEDIATAAHNSIRELKAIGLAHLDQLGMEAKRTSLQQAHDSGVQALASLATVASVAHVQFRGCQSDVHRLKTLASCLAKAPLESEHLRHEGLRAPSVTHALEDKQNRLKKILAAQADFDRLLYTDQLPSDGELKDAIVTLREGQTWYRFMQSRWRHSVGLHKRLERTKRKQSASERLATLESLRTHLNNKKEWHQDEVLRAAAGPHFDGEHTPLEGLIACARWIAETSDSLASVGVSREIIDPLEIERSFLLILANQIGTIESAISRLAESISAVNATLCNDFSLSTGKTEEIDWNTRFGFLQQMIIRIMTAEQLMSAFVRPGASAENGLGALLDSREIPRLIAELDSHPDGHMLLGDRFLGANTDLESILAAHAYGSEIKKARLPAPIERVLLSEHCAANYQQLNRYLTEINKGWKAENDFSQAMTEHGTFESAKWCDPADRSTSEYANALAKRTLDASEASAGLLSWAQYVGARQLIVSDGLGSFASLLEDGSVPAHLFEHVFRYRFYSSVAHCAFDNNPILRRFSGMRHTSVRKEFSELDKKTIGLRGQKIAHDCCRSATPPTGNHGVRVDDKTEMRLLEHLVPQQRPRVPLRQIMRRAGRAVQELKPCFMMGPQGVAQFLEPGRLHFDIVVMDEASQLRPEEAIGAIARGSQLVVVGDPKQLPPTSFFSRMMVVDNDDEMGQLATSEAESILDVCIGHFRPVRTLRWHYRSLHESLIAFSNHYFYQGRLVVFPSPHPKSKALGLRLHYVADGVYDGQMNLVEARRVVDGAIEHILYRPGDSLGIVTLNLRQRDLISEMLEQRLSTLPAAREYHDKWESERRGLFVKNLENVQGDERDCILISTTFGKPRGVSVVRQNFGPISREGGWRRLNVLFTRARKSVAIYSSMMPEDIIVDAQTPGGTRALRNYLEYARTGVLPIEDETGLAPDSDFEIAVMDVLTSRGYEVVPQLGVAGYRIDIGVRHPRNRSGYLAAIECDGASYHSGVSVRDRDRIRQQVLEDLGWRGRIWRIWSTDWFRDPLAETNRLLQFLDELKGRPIPDEYVVEDTGIGSSPQGVSSQGSSYAETDDGAEGLVIEDEEEDLEVRVGDIVVYSQAETPDQLIHVLITSSETNVNNGMLGRNTPLGTVLMGATVGETVVLRVPGRPPKSFVIQSIKRGTRNVD